MVWFWHDLHIHTYPHSPDAEKAATLLAMLTKAAKNGVSVIGLANHYFPPTEFNIFQKLRQEVATLNIPNITVLVGAELCALNTDGHIALTDAEAAQLDFVIAGPHHFKQRWVQKAPRFSASRFVKQQHQMLINAAKHPLVNGLAHPWVINIQHSLKRWGFLPKQFLAIWTEDHFAQLGQVAKEYNTALEIGMGIHLMAHHQGEIFWQKYRRGLQVAKECGAKFYFGSDAHHLFVIARLDWLKPTLKELGFTPDDIISPQDWVFNNKK